MRTQNRTAYMELFDEDPTWPENISNGQKAFLILFPIISILIIFVGLRIIWYPVHLSSHSTESERQSLTDVSDIETNYGSSDTHKANNDSVQMAQSRESRIKRSHQKKLIPGEIAGDYRDDWMHSFDISFLIGMTIYLVVLLILTSYTEHEIFSNIKFWLFRITETIVMMLVSTIGGLVCRYFCEIDELGYIITSRHSSFKVNYTRKIQHFCAYLVPLILPSGSNGNRKTIVELAWGDFFTLLGFLVSYYLRLYFLGYFADNLMITLS